MGVGLCGVRLGSVTSYRSHYKALCYSFVACLIKLLDYANFGGRNANRGLTMVPMGRELVSSYRLSIQTTLVSGTVWSQFLPICDATFDWGLPTPSLGEWVVVWGQRLVP